MKYTRQSDSNHFSLLNKKKELGIRIHRIGKEDREKTEIEKDKRDISTRKKMRANQI